MSGTMGMKWGKRNGPPYPLSRQKRFGGTEKNKEGASNKGSNSSGNALSKNIINAVKNARAKKKASKKEESRQRILESPRKLYKNRRKFSDQEIERALKRFDLDRRLKEASREKMTRGSKWIDALLGYAKSAKSAYNIVTGVQQTTMDTESKKRDLHLKDLDIKKKNEEIKKLQEEIKKIKRGK